MSIADRVAAGAAWLDETRPGWVDEVRLDELDLNNSTACVLGQIVKGECDKVGYDTWGYYDVVEVARGERRDAVRAIDDLGALFMTVEFAVDHAFHASTLGTNEWQNLTDEWKRVITERRGA